MIRRTQPSQEAQLATAFGDMSAGSPPKGPAALCPARTGRAA